MKISSEKLTTETLHPIYFISGDEMLLVNEATALIRNAANKIGFNERKKFHADKSFDWDSLAQSGANLSLFSDKQILELHLPTGKPGTKGAKSLANYAEHSPADTILIITAPKIDKQTQKSKWFTALEKAGLFVQIWPIEQQQLPSWIANRLKKRDLQTDTDGLAYFANRVSGNLLAAAQEVEKLHLIYGSGKITLDDISEVISDNAQFDSFSLVDNALAGKTNTLPRMLSNLKGEGIEPILILWAITREVRTLANISYALAKGEAMQQLFYEYRVWEKRKPLIQQSLKRFSFKTWQSILNRTYYLDRLIKGMEIGNIWDELLRLVLMIAGTQTIKRRKT